MKCPFCNSELRGSLSVRRSTNYLLTINDYNCSECGQFGMVDDALEHRIPAITVLEKATVAAFICERALAGKKVIVLWDSRAESVNVRDEIWISFPRIIDEFPLPALTERLDRVLLNLAKKADPGGAILVGPGTRGLFFADGPMMITFIVNSLLRRGYVEGSSALPGTIRMTIDGWQRVEELNKGRLVGMSKQAFVAMWFDASMDKIFDEGIKPAIEKAGFSAMRIDRKQSNNQITDEIIAEIHQSRFMVADCTEHRPAVYYEAGLMHGLGRPVIFTCHEDHLKGASFDTNHYPHIKWKKSADLKESLFERIRATLVDTPELVRK
jgi:hypothetical protein